MSNNPLDHTPQLTLSMIVRNEADRYLSQVLESAREYITDAVIIDDGSTDHTVHLCHQLLDTIPHKVIENKQSGFQNEWQLRNQQWTETISTDPDWILFLDADEIFEDKFKTGVQDLLQNDDCSVYLFRLYDFWDEDHYREDTLWCAHQIYRPFMLRYHKDAEYIFRQTDLHCGRMPANVFDFKHELSPYRLKHLGWAREADRIAKYKRYLTQDPMGVYGSLAQYFSILDPEPALVKWEENEVR